VPKVSIVTPSYNQAGFIEETIQSILGQNYPDIEYIIVDGASTDGSPEIIRKYESQLAWWVSEPDKGQSDAINKGFAHATGDILTWVCSDDTLLPGAVSTIVDLFARHPDAGMIYGDALLTDPAGEKIGVCLGKPYSLRTLTIYATVPQPASFFSRAAWEQFGPLDSKIHFAMDRDLFLRMAGRTPIYYEPALLATMREHPESKSVRDRSPTRLSEIAILDNYFRRPDTPAEALAARPTFYGRQYYYLGLIYLQQGQYDKAEAALRQSIQWQPRHRRRLIASALLLSARRRSTWLAYAYPALMGKLVTLRLRLQGRGIGNR